MTQNPKDFHFILNPEPRQTQVNITQGNYIDIVVTAKNLSQRPVRVQAIIAPLDMLPGIETEPLSANVWQNWLEIRSDQPEWPFAEDGTRQFVVRINLPADAALGTYRFRLLISGVENPDEEYDESDPISFTVVGPEMNIQPFVISAAVILVLIILGVIAAALLIRPRPSLKASLDVPPDAVQGQPASYVLKIENTGAQAAENVTADYRLPATVIAASAFVRGENVRHCDASDRQIHCDLGLLAANGLVEVNFLAIPGPQAQVITNTQVMTVSAQLAGVSQTASILPSQKLTRVSSAPGPFAVALNASTLTPVFEEGFTYQVFAWGTITTTQQMSLTFRLPAGLRYMSPLPAQCSHVQEDYFTLECGALLGPAANNDAVTVINIHASATAIVAEPARLQAVTNLALGQIQSLALPIQVVNTALFFDGIQDWAQLGYQQANKTFSVAMWVHPYSSDDGQSFIGLHRPEPDHVRNLFLVGYWDGGLHVDLNGDFHNLVMPKRTDRYHLAVVVQSIGSDQSKVTVYVDGVEQEWEEPEDPSVCDRCKIFDSTLPGDENPIPWVLGQDWDQGSQGPITSDFFHGTLADVQIWNTALSKDQIQKSYQVRPQGTENGLAAYYRLEPLTPERDVLVSRAASAAPGKRMGAKWVEAEALYGTALRFNGYTNALAAPDLKLQNFQPDANGEVEVTMAAWVMVDAIPSVQEWILGSTVPVAGTLTLAPGASPEAITFETPSAADQAELASAQSELLAAQQASAALGLDLNQVSANRFNARQRLILALYNLVKTPQAATSPDIGLLNKLLEQDFNPANVEATTAELGSLATSAGVTQNISSTVVTLQDSLARISRYRTDLAGLNSQATADIQTASAVVSATMSSPTEASAMIPPLPAAAQTLVDKTRLQVLILDEAASYYTNLKGLVQAGEKEGFSALLQARLPRVPTMLSLVDPNLQINQYTQAGVYLSSTAAYKALKYLALVDRIEAELVKISTDTGAGAQRIEAFRQLPPAQANLDQALAALADWLQTGNDSIFQQTLTGGSTSIPDELRTYIAALATAQYNLKRFTNAQANEAAVQAAQARQTAAKERVDAAQAQVDAVQLATQDVRDAAAERQANENEVVQASLALNAAKTDSEKQSAQVRLAIAQANLQISLEKQYTNLQSGMDGMLLREPVLANLDPRLNFAVDQATEAAFSAMQRYNVERWIGPWLDLILHTKTPRQTSEEAIRPAALLAAQVALKKKTDSDVDVTQNKLKTNLEKQSAMVNSGGEAAQRQDIIDQINAYIESLNKDVNAAQKEFNDALAAQQGDLGESQIPLVLAEALAQTVADQVTAETIRLTPEVDISSLLSSSAGLASQAKQNVRSKISNALEAARRPLRIKLYYQTAFLIQRLDRELASNGLEPQEKQLKSNLRSQLAASNNALLRLLNAQNVLLRPTTGLGSLVGQVADASQSAASVEVLLKTFEDTLKNANQSLKLYLIYAQARGQFKDGSSQTAQNSSQPLTSTGNNPTAAATPTPTAATNANGSPANGATTQTNLAAQSKVNAPAATPEPFLAGLQQTGTPELAASQTQTTTQAGAAGFASEPANLWAGLMVDADGHVILAARSTSGEWSWDKDEKPLPVLQWIHYAIVFRYNVNTGQITDYQLYRNGSRVKGDVSGSEPDLKMDALACPAGFYIGGLCDQNGRYYFAGRIDEVRVWNRALNHFELDAWRKLPGVTYDEVAYWPFDDGPGHTEAGNCADGRTCDRAPGGDYNLLVTGPAWLDAEAGLSNTVRP